MNVKILCVIKIWKNQRLNKRAYRNDRIIIGFGIVSEFYSQNGSISLRLFSQSI